MSSKKPSEPHVGIFWLFDGTLIIDSTPVSRAEPYADSLGHSTGHIDHWALLQRKGAVPTGVEYEEAPRGRVVFDRREDQFYLLADKCILHRPEVVQRIMESLHLPMGTKLGADAHYRCFACLYGNEVEDDWEME